MPVSLLFEQVDVFSEQSFKGNAVAVVIGADDLTSQQMHDFAAWTQLSETTFLLKPNSPEAHYRVRIFTPLRELPFAGHPTLGSCHVWLNQSGGNVDKEIIQECLAGLIRIRRNGAFLSFAAPPLVRSGAVGGDVLRQIESGLGLSCDQILASQWVDNGPGWVAVMMASRDDVLAIRPDYLKLNGLNVGVVAPWQGPHADADVEVRAFMGEELNEDPVTGSLNASLAQWLISTGVMPDHYTASQGTALGRQGRIKIEKIGSDIWVGGEVQLGMSGRVMF